MQIYKAVGKDEDGNLIIRFATDVAIARSRVREFIDGDIQVLTVDVPSGRAVVQFLNNLLAEYEV